MSQTVERLTNFFVTTIYQSHIELLNLHDWVLQSPFFYLLVYLLYSVLQISTLRFFFLSTLLMKGSSLEFSSGFLLFLAQNFGDGSFWVFSSQDYGDFWIFIITFHIDLEFIWYIWHIICNNQDMWRYVEIWTQDWVKTELDLDLNLLPQTKLRVYIFSIHKMGYSDIDLSLVKCICDEVV